VSAWGMSLLLLMLEALVSSLLFEPYARPDDAK
jgi:hypothetical protein